MKNPYGIDSEYPCQLLSVVRVLKDGKPVKYDSDDGGSYSGFKHSAVCLYGEEFPPTVIIHNNEQLMAGMYNLVTELVPEGKVKTRNHYIYDNEATQKLSKQS